MQTFFGQIFFTKKKIGTFFFSHHFFLEIFAHFGHFFRPKLFLAHKNSDLKKWDPYVLEVQGPEGPESSIFNVVQYQHLLFNFLLKNISF